MHLHHAYGNNAYPVIPAGQVLPADESARFDMPSWQPLQEPPHCGRPPLHPCPRKKDQSTIPLESKTTVSSVGNFSKVTVCSSDCSLSKEIPSTRTTSLPSLRIGTGN